MKKYYLCYLITIFLLLNSATSLAAQTLKTNPTPSCPAINVSSPALVDPGAVIFVSVKVSGGDPDVTPTYNWTVSAGKISFGQGTAKLTVETTGLTSPNDVTVTVDVGGFDRNCSASQSSSISIGKKTVVPGKVSPSPDKTTSAQKNSQLLERAKGLIENKEYDRAAKDLTNIIALEPNNSEALAQRARMYYLRQDFTNALADAENAIKINSKNAVALNIRGLIKLSQNETDSALADFTNAIGSNPNYAKAYINRARIMRSKNEFEKAIADYTLAIKTDPKSGYAYLNRGIIYLYDKREYQNAITDFSKAIEIDSKDKEAYMRRADANLQLKNYQDSISDANQALKI
ncbi:MAG TPA: tetratricopeptide repeat protein [Pyrinomonadaceae bacterium]|nr:tetratricopeptide repeat protein [Pyrinomonadaceae bacterium]